MLPSQYAWLTKLSPLPRMIEEALKLYGTTEVSGSRNNPQILAWADEVGLEAVYTADSIPWCGLFMAVVAKRACKLWPRSSASSNSRRGSTLGCVTSSRNWTATAKRR